MSDGMIEQRDKLTDNLLPDEMVGDKTAARCKKQETGYRIQTHQTAGASCPPLHSSHTHAAILLSSQTRVMDSYTVSLPLLGPVSWLPIDTPVQPS